MTLFVIFLFNFALQSFFYAHAELPIRSSGSTICKNIISGTFEKYFQVGDGSLMGIPVFDEKIIIDDATKESTHTFNNEEIIKGVETDFALLYTTQQNPHRLFCLLNSREKLENQPQKLQKQVSLPLIYDANGTASRNIFPLASLNFQFQKEFERFIAVAVQGAEKSGDGIAVIRTEMPEVEQPKEGRLFDNEIISQKMRSTSLTFKQLSANHNFEENSKITAFPITMFKQFMTDSECPFNINLAKSCCSVDTASNTLFIGLEVTIDANATREQSVIPLIRARIEDEKLVALPLSSVPVSKLAPYGLSASGASTTISIKNINRLVTTLGKISHLVCLIETKNSDRDFTNQHISVIPLAQTEFVMKDISLSKQSLSPLYSSLAPCDALPIETFIKRNDKHIEHTGYMFYQPSTIHADYLPNPVPELPNEGEVIQMRTAGDSLFIAFNNETSSTIFKTSALFDKHARIISWTDWELVSVYPDRMIDFHVNGSIRQVTPILEMAFENISLNQTISEYAVRKWLPELANSGVDAITETDLKSNSFPEITMIQANDIVTIAWPVNRSSAKTCVSLYDSIESVYRRTEKEVYRDTNNIRSSGKQPVVGIWNNGAPTRNVIACTWYNKNFLCLTPNALYKLVVESEINKPESIIEIISNNLPVRWEKIAEGTHLKKLIKANNCVFVLGSKSVSRIIELEDATLQLSPIYEAGNNKVCFDAAFFGPLAIIATSDGIIHSAPGMNVCSAPAENLKEWINFGAADQSFIPTELFLLLPSDSYEPSQRQDAQLFVVYYPLNKKTTLIYRYNVHVDNFKNVVEKPITPLIDFKIQTTQYPLFNFGERRYSFFTDGFFYGAVIDDPHTKLPILCNLGEAGSKRGNMKLDKKMVQALLPAEIIQRGTRFQKSRLNLNMVYKSNHTGSLLIGGEFGLIVR